MSAPEESLPPPPESAGRMIARNSAWLIGANVLGKVLTVIFLAFAANKLQAASYGTFQFVLALGGIFHVTLDLGYATLMIERGSKNRADLHRHYLGNLGLRVLSYPGTAFIFAAVVAAIASSGLGGDLFSLDGENLTILALAIATVLVHAHFYLQRGALMALENFAPVAAAETLERAVYFVLGLATLFAFGSLVPFLAVSVIAPLAKCALLEVHLRRADLKGPWKPDAEFIRTFAAAAAPHALYSVAGMLMLRVDQIMIGLFRGPAEVGFYSVAYDKVFGLVMMGQLVANALTPTASRCFANSRDEYFTIFSRAFFLLAVLGLPMTTGIALCAQGITQLFHTAEYAETWRALVWLAPYIMLRFWSFLYAAMLLAAGRISIHLAAETTGLAVKLGLNAVLIPIHGYVGAAMAVAAAEATVLLVDALLARRIGLPLLPLSRCWQPMLATLLMAGAVWALGAAPVLVQIAAGAAVYVVAVLALGVHRREPAVGRILASLPLIGGLFR